MTAGHRAPSTRDLESATSVDAQRTLRTRLASAGPPPASRTRSCGDVLVQPVLFLELARQVGLRQVLEVLVRERVELVLEAARQHALDLLLPGLLLEPGVVHQLLRARDVLVVELDADVARELVGLGVGTRQADELGLGDRHALALEREVDRALLDDRVDVVAPR